MNVYRGWSRLRAHMIDDGSYICFDLNTLWLEIIFYREKDVSFWLSVATTIFTHRQLIHRGWNIDRSIVISNKAARGIEISDAQNVLLISYFYSDILRVKREQTRYRKGWAANEMIPDLVGNLIHHFGPSSASRMPGKSTVGFRNDGSRMAMPQGTHNTEQT